jgi:hypothetical protein
LPTSTLPFVVNTIWSAPSFEEYWKSIVAYFEGLLPKNVLEHREPPRPQISGLQGDILEVVGISEDHTQLLLLYKKKDYLIYSLLFERPLSVGDANAYDYAHSVLVTERKRIQLDLVLENRAAADVIFTWRPVEELTKAEWEDTFRYEFEHVYAQVKRNEPWLDRKIELYHASQEALRRLLASKPKKPALRYSVANGNMRESSLTYRGKRFREELLLPDALFALKYGQWTTLEDDEKYLEYLAPKSHFTCYDMLALIFNGVVNTLSDLEFLWSYSKMYRDNPPLDFVP